MLIKNFFDLYGLEPIGLRYFNVFGKRQDFDGSYAAVIPKWIAAMIDGDQVVIYGDGETSRDFCHINNVVQANILAALLSNPEAVNQVYNVAVGERTTLNQLFDLLSSTLKGFYPAIEVSTPIYREFRPGDVRHSLADISQPGPLIVGLFADHAARRRGDGSNGVVYCRKRAPEQERLMTCTPNLFVIGAMKAGTTFLYSVLDSHPDICMSPIKEPNYFSSDLWDVSAHIEPGTEARIDDALSRKAGLHNALIKDEFLYKRLFSKCKKRSLYCGEASPTYLRSRVAAKNIFSFSPQAKVILLLRDPVERAWSHYVMERNEARVPDSLEMLMEQELAVMKDGGVSQHGILESGLYYNGLSRFLKFFLFENILIMDQSELFNAPTSLARKLGLFLGVDASLFILDRDLANTSVSPRYPRLNKYMAVIGLKKIIRNWMPKLVMNSLKKIYYQKAPTLDFDANDPTYLKLVDFYSADVKELSGLLGSVSPTWTKKYL